MGKTAKIAERDAKLVDTPETLQRTTSAKLARALRVATTRYARQPGGAHWDDVEKAFAAAADQRRGVATSSEPKKAKKPKADE